MTLLTADLHRRISEVNDDEDSELALATATWSMICEPGDRLAGMLCQYLGQIEALLLLINNAGIDEYIACLKSRGLLEDARFAFSNLEKTLAEGVLRWKPRLKQASIKEHLNTLMRIGGHLLTPNSLNWPTRLQDLNLATPHALWVRGQVAKLTQLESSIALVGSRNSTSYGEYVTTELVSALVAKDIAVVSGGAYGIDAIAHRSTLALRGTTAAILAGGCDRLYPSGNQKLLTDVIRYGILISELPPGSTPTKWRFLMRNRLIAAISSATVVVEAGLPSGAISTANHAALLDRPVGAVPGSIASAASSGCHVLIQEAKAELISSVDDAIALVSSGHIAYRQTTLDGLGALETRVLDTFADKSMSLEEICLSAGVTSGEAQMALGSLELLGLVARGNSGFSKLR